MRIFLSREGEQILFETQSPTKNDEGASYSTKYFEGCFGDRSWGIEQLCIM